MVPPFARRAWLTAQSVSESRALYHTFNNQIGIALWDLLYVWRDLSPERIGFNYAIGHVVQDSPTNGPTSMWASNLRAIMPYLKGMPLQDNQWVKAAVNLVG